MVLSRAALGSVLAAATLASGCGGNKGSESVTAACDAAPSPLASTPPLPRGFPSPPQVVYTSVSKQGPTTIVKGYRRGEIDGAFDTYSHAFKTPYSVTHDEHEEDDAEVNFAGPGTSGQVKLLQACKDRTTVTVTVRPA
jgi:hypothetical protein